MGRGLGGGWWSSGGWECRKLGWDRGEVEAVWGWRAGGKPGEAVGQGLRGAEGSDWGAEEGGEEWGTGRKGGGGWGGDRK